LSFVASSPYPGVSVDSGEYLAVAESVIDGDGLTMAYVSYDEAYRILTPGERVPMTQFPPLYPSLLALVAGVGDASLLIVVRYIGAVAYGLTVALSASLVWRATAATWAAVIATALLLAPELVSIHAMAWSEQLMLLGLLGCLLFAGRYARSARASDLAGLGLCAAAASLARFAGVSTVIAGAVVVWLAHDGPRRARLFRAALFLAITIAPTVAWFVRNRVVTGAVSDKEAAWHPPSLTVLGQAAQTIGGWVTPWRVTTMAAGVVIVAALAWGLVRRRPMQSPPELADLCVVFGAAYAAFLVVARTLIDQNIPFDTRLLSPLQVLAGLAVCIAATRMRDGGRRVVATALLVALAAAAVARGTVTAFRFSGTTVAAYSNEQWRSSETLAYVEGLPKTTMVITNAPDPIWLWDRRVAQILPPRSSLYSGTPSSCATCLPRRAAGERCLRSSPSPRASRHARSIRSWPGTSASPSPSFSRTASCSRSTNQPARSPSAPP
jgi:hypothetical protein